MLDQDGLSRTRAAVHVEGGRLPAAHGLERGFQDLEMPLPADQQRGLSRRRPLREGHVRLIRPVAQSTDHFSPRRPCVRIPAEQLEAQRIEVVRNIGRELTRGQRLDPLLIDQYLERPAEEREPAGQGLVEHHADTVPITRRRYRQACCLFRRHVRDRADDVRLRALVEVGLLQLGGEAEVEQDDASVTVDEHVGGLDVAVELAGVVQSRDPRGELPQRSPEANQVAQSRAGLPGGRGRMVYLRCPPPEGGVVMVG